MIFGELQTVDIHVLWFLWRNLEPAKCLQKYFYQQRKIFAETIFCVYDKSEKCVSMGGGAPLGGDVSISYTEILPFRECARATGERLPNRKPISISSISSTAHLLKFQQNQFHLNWVSSKLRVKLNWQPNQTRSKNHQYHFFHSTSLPPTQVSTKLVSSQLALWGSSCSKLARW